MFVYRICDKEEVLFIFENQSIHEMGNFYCTDLKKNTHSYQSNKRYLHFFEKYEDVFYLDSDQKKYICTYDLSKKILDNSRGYGYYLDRIFFRNIQEVPEFAVESSLISFYDLKRIERITGEFSFEEYVTTKGKDSIILIYTADSDCKKDTKVFIKK